MKPIIRIILVDDHTLFREGLKFILGACPDLVVSGEAGTVADGLRLAHELDPDLVLLDLSLPDRPGLSFLAEFRRTRPRTPVLVVSMLRKAEHVVGAFQAGATGYVTKEAASERLIEGVQSVLRGAYYVDSAISGNVIELLIEAERREKTPDARYGTLTAREQEVMRLLAAGLSAREVGARLFISSKTVDNHRANIMRKLGLDGAVDMVRYAARLGLIELDT